MPYKTRSPQYSTPVPGGDASPQYVLANSDVLGDLPAEAGPSAGGPSVLDRMAGAPDVPAYLKYGSAVGGGEGPARYAYGGGGAAGPVYGGYPEGGLDLSGSGEFVDPLAGLGDENPDRAETERMTNREETLKSGKRVKGLVDPDVDHPHYLDESRKASFRGTSQYGNLYTQYWDDAKQAAHVLTADSAKGTVGMAGSDAVLDSSSATGAGTQQVRNPATGMMEASGKGKLIYTMDEAGVFRAVDPAAEMIRKPMPGAENDPVEKGNTQVGFVNHSSMVRGKGVQGAGDMAIDQGRVTSLSNTSGHYRPDIGMLHQAAAGLGDMGALGVNTTIDMNRASGGPSSTSALTFMAASQGQGDIARSAFGSAADAAQVDATAAKKKSVMQELLKPGGK